MHKKESTFEIQRYVSEQDPTYQKKIEERKKYDDKYVFGYRGVKEYERGQRREKELEEDIRSIQEEIDTLDKDSPTARAYANAIATKRQWATEAAAQNPFDTQLRSEFKHLAKQLHLFSGQKGEAYSKRELFAWTELVQMLDDPEIQQELKKHFKEDLSDFFPLNFYLKVADGSLPSETLYQAAKRHEARIHEQEQALLTFVEEKKKEFRQFIEQRVSSRQLPQTALEGLGRIDRVTIHISDTLADLESTTVGHFDRHQRIGIANENLIAGEMDAVKKTLFHEWLHAISGSSINVETRTYPPIAADGDPTKFHSAYQKKVGLSVANGSAGYASFSWLNEAVTEDLAVALTGRTPNDTEGFYKGSNSYPEERQELDRLRAMGLEEDLLMKAYFENFSTGQAKEERGKYFQALIKRIDALEGPQGFTRLENESILRRVRDSLSQTFILPVKDSDHQGETDKHIRFTVSVGHQSKTTIEGSFSFTPIDYEGAPTPEEQWNRAKKQLDIAIAPFGRKTQYRIDTNPFA